MKYVIILLLLVASIYPFSYAKYNITKKNYFGAAGIILLILVSVSFSAYLLLTR